MKHENDTYGGRRRRLLFVCAFAALLSAHLTASAQHTLGLVGGGGMTNSRLYPAEERRAIWGVMSGGVSWRYYSEPRFVGGVGLDLEYIQRGFSYAPDSHLHINADGKPDKGSYHYYTRRYNTLSLPVVWQPHVYLLKNHLRFYLEAMLNFELNLNAHYDYRLHDGSLVSAPYNMTTVRDNRFGYGLAGGGGLDVLVGCVEFGVRVRYYFGLSDVMRNRNKYYDNGLDDKLENPFGATPLRSPVDNLMISFKVGIRLSRGGFTEWNIKRPKRDKRQEVFKFNLD